MPDSATASRSAPGSGRTSRGSGSSAAATWSRSPAAASPTRWRPGSRRRPTTASRARPPTQRTSSACGRSSTSRSSAKTLPRPQSGSRASARSVSESDLVRIGISPHAPYTCSLEVYRYCLSLGIPVGTHLAESDGENEWLEHGTGPLEPARDVLVAPTGKRAVATLAEVLCPELLCAHCVALDDGEIAVLAGADVPVAHCPRSNALLGCGVAPLGELTRAGIRVGSAPTRRPRLRPSTPGTRCGPP